MALSGVDLRLARGQVYVLLGPNGAGKTTLIRILAMLEQPSAGHVRIAGIDARRRPIEVRRLIGAVLHQSLLYGDLTAEENLLLYARLYDLDDARKRVRETLDGIGLGHRATDPVRTLSRGMRQCLSVARAVLHTPHVLLLDEPYSGLDCRSALYVSRTIERAARGGCAVLLTTHELDRGLQVGDRLGILSGGRMLAEMWAREVSPAALRRLYPGALVDA